MKYSYPSGSWYEGEIVNGNFQGVGKFYFNNGDLYEGDFKDDMFDGQGMYKFKSGCSYNGMFSNDEFHGIGTYTFEDGSVEKGKFHQGKRVGKFIQVSDNNYYQIIYNNDKPVNCQTIDKENIPEERLPYLN